MVEFQHRDRRLRAHPIDRPEDIPVHDRITDDDRPLPGQPIEQIS
jgi:hypothetical protein